MKYMPFLNNLFLFFYTIQRPNLTAATEAKFYWFHKMPAVSRPDYLNSYAKQYELGKQSENILWSAESQPLTGSTRSAALLQ